MDKPITHKICTKCKTNKALSEYAPDRRATDRKQSQCKQCTNTYKKSRKAQEIVAFDYYE